MLSRNIFCYLMISKEIACYHNSSVAIMNCPMGRQTTGHPSNAILRFCVGGGEVNRWHPAKPWLVVVEKAPDWGVPLPTQNRNCCVCDICFMM